MKNIQEEKLSLHLVYSEQVKHFLVFFIAS